MASSSTESNNPLEYRPEQVEEVISGLVRGECHLLYGPGGTGKTYEGKRLCTLAKTKGYNVLMTALMNATANKLDREALGIYEMFSFTVHPDTGLPVSKLDVLCRSIRRANPHHIMDKLWDGQPATDRDKKAYIYTKKFINGSISSMSDREIIASIDITKARFMQLDCAVAFKRIVTAHFIAIEELFTVPDVLLELIESTFRKYRGVDRIMGGCGLLVSGDVLQTVPIRGSFVFMSDVWRQLNPIAHIFTVMKRFSDPVWGDMLLRLRRGVVTEEDDRRLRSRRQSAAEMKDSCAIRATRAEADIHNDRELSKLPGTSYRIRARDVYYRLSTRISETGAEETDAIPLIGSDREIATRMISEKEVIRGTELPTELRIKVGSRVIMKHNDRSRRVFNGYMGTITAISYQAYTDEQAKLANTKGSINHVSIQFDKEFTHTLSELGTVHVGEIVEREVVDDVSYVCTSKVLRIEGADIITNDTITIDRVIRKHTSGPRMVERRQFPFELGWARTIHKAQGATLDSGSMRLAGKMSDGQAYTACSRFRSLDDVVIQDDYDPRCVHANSLALRFDDAMISTGVWNEIAPEVETEQQEYDEDGDVHEMTAEMEAFLQM